MGFSDFGFSQGSIRFVGFLVFPVFGFRIENEFQDLVFRVLCSQGSGLNKGCRIFACSILAVLGFRVWKGF